MSCKLSYTIGVESFGTRLFLKKIIHFFFASLSCHYGDLCFIFLSYYVLELLSPGLDRMAILFTTTHGQTEHRSGLPRRGLYAWVKTQFCSQKTYKHVGMATSRRPLPPFKDTSRSLARPQRNSSRPFLPWCAAAAPPLRGLAPVRRLPRLAGGCTPPA